MSPKADVIKILIAADEPSVREALQALLEQSGHTVYAVADLNEVDEMLTKHACEATASPDVVVVDASLLPADELEPLDSSLLDEVQRLRADKRAYQEGVEGDAAQPSAATVPERDRPSTYWPRTADLEESNKELRTLVEIGREVSATLDMTQVLKRVSQLAADVCGAHRCTIVLIGDDGEMSRPAMSAFSNGHKDHEMWRLFREASYPVPLTEIPEAQRVIREQSPLFIADAEASSLPKRLIEPFGIKSVLLVPLISKKWVVGLMALDHVEEGRRFTARQIDVATWVAAQATLAIENARLYQQARRQARYGALLSLVARQANTILEPERLLPAVAETIHEHFRYDSVIIMLMDAKAGDLIIGGKAGIGADAVPDDYRQPLDQGIIGWVARHGQCLASNDARQEERYFAPFPDRYQAGSELALPLRIESEVIGVLDLQCQERRRFDELDVATASTLAEQIAIALQNARLHEEEQHHVEVLTALRNIDLAINSTLSLDEVLERVYEQLSRLMDITTFYIGLYQDTSTGDIAGSSGNGKLYISLIVDRGRRLDPVALDLEEDGGFAGWVVRNKEPLWIDDWERDQETLPVEGIARGTPTRSLMVLPLLARDELIGVISAQSYEPHAFDEEHRRIFSGISNQVAIAVEKARLFEELKRRLREMRLLQQVMQAGAITLDFDKVLERTIDALHHMLGIEHLSFALPDLESEVFGHQEASSADGRHHATALKLHPSQIGYAPEMTKVRIPLDRSVAGRAYLTGEAQIIDDVRETPGYFEGAPEVLSELNVPVRVAGRVIAVLNAESPKTNAFDEDDLRLFQAVAAQLGIVLENARLYQRLQEQRDKLSQAYDELKEIDRLRTELVQNVSHELRTPFTLVQGYIELLMAGDLGSLSAKQQEALMIIRKRIDALQRRTRDLTTLDSLSREKPMSRPVCLLEAVEHAALELKARACSAGVRLYKALPDALPPVMANREHLTQAFTHLIENAIKFSPDGGTITLQAWEDDGSSCVAVKDEGIGIKQEHLDRIFERFYQVDGSIKRRFEGMGIGLALVWEIVEVYGGHVTVRSSPQAGSTFIVSLPQATSPKADGSFREGGGRGEV